MLLMEYQFKHSLVVMGQLAKDTARTPPSENDPPFEYVDRSLTILGRTFDANNQKMQQEFLSQREFIASQFRGVEKKIEEVEKKMDGRFEEVDSRFEEVEKKMDGRFEEVHGRFEEVHGRFEEVHGRFEEVHGRFEELEKKMDGRFEELEKKMDGRFEEVEKKIDGRFQEVDRRFDKQEGDIRDIKVQLENSAAITRNGRLSRMHQPINLIKVLRPTNDPNKFVWASHPQVPKHVKGVYILGQRAKGIFEPRWDRTSNEQKLHAKRRALNTIETLANFHNVVLCSDEESESDATEVILQDWTVDDYMQALLYEWGMDWQKVLGIAEQHVQAQPQQAGAKRAGDASNRGEKKKIRGGRQEESD
ncbi:MAG: hypothetical protein Q9217_006434 [Psora testacea]